MTADLDLDLPGAVADVLDDGVAPVVPVDVTVARLRHEQVDDELLAVLVGYLNQSMSAATRRAYSADWRTFTAWCQAQGLTPLPATPLTVAVYLAAAASTLLPTSTADRPVWRYSPRTLERHTAAIVAVHNAHQAPSPRDALVRQTLAALRRARKTPPVKSRPAELDDIRKMLAQRPPPGWPGGPARRRDRCLLLFGFAGALRRSETSAVDLAEVDYRPGDGLRILIPSSKTDQTGEGDVIALPYGSDPLTCPVCAYLAWLEVLDHHRAGGLAAVRGYLAAGAGDEPASERSHRDHDRALDLLGERRGPLFVPITRYGHLGTKAMSGDAVHDLVRRYAARAGLPAALFSGHSLRAGFATTAARAGAPNRQIMRQGRWKSHATVDGYIRLANPLDDNAVTKLGL